MTGGGLMQLVAYGAQDVYLTGNPQITFFKVVYRRHTNFAMESIENPFNGSPGFGRKVTCTIQRNGDLIYRIYLQATLPKVTLQSTDGSGAQFRWLNWVGHNLVKNVELEIGGQRIDKHYGDWLQIWNELTQEAGKQAGYAKMVGNVPQLVNLLVQGGEDCDNDCSGGEPNSSNEYLMCAPEYTLYIPLQFWFNRNPGLALPLIALQYHEVRINLEFNDLRNLCFDQSPALSNVHTVRDRVAAAGLVAASLYVDYIYLDTDERRKFAQVSHEYLIETLQFTGGESITSSSNKLKLNFNHPCKELIWVVQRDSFVSCDDNVINPWKGQQPFNYSDWWDRAVLESGYSVTRVEGLAGNNPTVTALLQLNGHDRFQVREGRYFNEVQPYQHHTNVPAVGINVYSFALQPEQHQPSGTCNLSRIDNTTLLLTVSNNAVGTATSATVRVYATNYNVLRIMSGMGGLAYSN
uniref:Major capsid protein N-terminal domain-containing protein n=1 Tax=viral metagenome TaxID=1070528 RepID=A0A6C0DK37_9ZZZZ